MPPKKRKPSKKKRKYTRRKSKKKTSLSLANVDLTKMVMRILLGGLFIAMLGSIWSSYRSSEKVDQYQAGTDRRIADIRSDIKETKRMQRAQLRLSMNAAGILGPIEDFIGEEDEEDE